MYSSAIVRTVIGLSLWVCAGMVASAWADPSADPLLNPSQSSFRNKQLLVTKVAKAGERLVSVGERGTILLSDDHGQTWRQVISPVRVTFTSVYFSSPQKGWVVGHGGIVLATMDGGENWVKQLDGRMAADLELEQAKAALVKTPTDEQSQHRVREAEGAVNDGPDKPFLDVHFSDDTHGLIVGAYGLAFQTEDGGKTWTSIMGRIDNPKGRHLYSVLATQSGAYIVGEQGSVFRSSDDGQTFKQMMAPGKGTLFGILVTQSGAIEAYGLRGALYRSENTGAQWRKIETSPASITSGKLLSDGSIVLVDEAGHLLRSEDDGKSFADVALAQSMSFSDVEQIDANSLIIAGVRGSVRVTITSHSQETSK